VNANVRIFTPNYEMAFAGHPSLGTAYVVRELSGAGDAVLLRMPAADIPLRVAGNVWTLQANAPTSFPVEVSRPDLSAMIGLTADRVAAEPLWVETATIQAILPLRSAHDVRAASADPQLLAEFAERPDGQSLVYLWAPTGADTIEARLFFTQNNAVIEDPATGSACANLGGWFLANAELGIRRRVQQGSAIKPPSVLDLAVDADGTIRVGGAVSEVGAGTFKL
jgi:trans-2,3-dihydro-3-hydroxyanthranilate isomerase